MALDATDTSSTLTFPNLGSATQICLVQQVSAETYTSTGLVAGETDADGNTTTYSYDADGNQISETGPEMQAGQPTTTDVYDALGRVTAEIDPLGNITAYSYSYGNSSDTVATSQGQSVPVSGDSATFNNLPQAPGQQRTYAVYVESTSSPTSDSYSVTETGGDGGLSWNPAETPSSVTPLGSNWYEVGTATLGIGDVSYALTVSYSGTVSISHVALLQQTSVDTYNDDGNLTSETDALGNTTYYAYNALGLPAQETDPTTGMELGPVYDKAGNMISDTDLMGNTTTYTYNSSGQVTQAQVFAPNAPTDDNPQIEIGASSFCPSAPGDWVGVNGGLQSTPNASSNHIARHGHLFLQALDGRRAV